MAGYETDVGGACVGDDETIGGGVCVQRGELTLP